MGTHTRRFLIRRFVFTCAVPFCAACGAEARSAEPTSVRLAAAVEHVRTLAPQTDLGLLASANSISLTSAGHVYVGDGSDRNIKVFGPDGVQGAPVGRAGAGPGEFVTLLSSGVLGDSVYGWDGTSNRLTVFRPDGRDARIIALRTLGSAPYARMRPMDDSLLVGSGWVMGVHDKPLVEVFDRRGRTVGRMMDLSRLLSPPDPRLLQHTSVFADGHDGVVFSTIHGIDTIIAYTPRGRVLGAGNVTLADHEPVLDLRRLLAANGGNLQRPDSSWVQDGHYAILKLVALGDGLVAVQYGKLEFEHGTDLLSDGGPIVVLRLGEDGVIRRVTQVESPGALLGRGPAGEALILRWSGTDLERLDLYRLALTPATPNGDD